MCIALSHAGLVKSKTTGYHIHVVKCALPGIQCARMCLFLNSSLSLLSDLRNQLTLNKDEQ